MPLVATHINAVTGVDKEALCGESGGNVVLSGKRIAARNVYLRTSGSQSLRKIGSLGLKMNGHRDLHASERLLALKSLFDAVENSPLSKPQSEVRNVDIPSLSRCSSSDKTVQRIIVLYSDNSFDSYLPAER